MFKDSHDAHMIGRIHGTMGAEQELFVADSSDAQFRSVYLEGYAEGQRARGLMLAQGKSDKWIEEYCDICFAGWLDADIHHTNGDPGPGRLKALERMSLKH